MGLSLFWLLAFSLSMTKVITHAANSVQIIGQSCHRQKDGYLPNSPGVVDSIDTCVETCDVSTQCESVTFFASKSCIHFSTKCPNMSPLDGAITVTPGVNSHWTLVAYGKECNQGGYLSSTSGKQDSVAKCVHACDLAPKCTSTTFSFDTKFCSHFSATCASTKETSTKTASMTKFTRQTQCDTSAGEVYRAQSSRKVSDLGACKKSCEDASECNGITLWKDGWCSHFRTKCAKQKFGPNAIAMGVTTTRTSTSGSLGIAELPLRLHTTSYHSILITHFRKV